jgi:hypothetical protein
MPRQKGHPVSGRIAWRGGYGWRLSPGRDRSWRRVTIRMMHRLMREPFVAAAYFAGIRADHAVFQPACTTAAWLVSASGTALRIAGTLLPERFFPASLPSLRSLCAPPSHIGRVILPMAIHVLRSPARNLQRVRCAQFRLRVSNPVSNRVSTLSRVSNRCGRTWLWLR